MGKCRTQHGQNQAPRQPALALAVLCAQQFIVSYHTVSTNEAIYSNASREDVMKMRNDTIPSSITAILR
jgi:hypothetical protein